jgi:hypothetical protein
MIPTSNKHGETVMTAQQDIWQEQQDDPEIRIDARVDPRVQDSYWQTAYWAESYYRDECTFDDYAPAYCVGYCGHAQYGGKFDEAEKSLCANWFRIKGDSRLTVEEAMQAIRAAWDHAALGERAEQREEERVDAGFIAAQGVQSAEPAYALA